MALDSIGGHKVLLLTARDADQMCQRSGCPSWQSPERVNLLPAVTGFQLIGITL